MKKLVSILFDFGFTVSFYKSLKKIMANKNNDVYIDVIIKNKLYFVEITDFAGTNLMRKTKFEGDYKIICNKLKQRLTAMSV